MRASILFSLLAACFLFLSGRPARGRPVAPLGASLSGTEVSMAMVSGRPAIAWVDPGNSTLQYVRAFDANGTGWGAPVAVASGVWQASRVTLREVNGRPAICFATGAGARFSRALDATGVAWPPAPVSLAGSFPLTVMEVINGKPAVLARVGPNLQYFRATDADGAAWAAPVTALTAMQFASIDLKEVGGRPAVMFTETRNAFVIFPPIIGQPVFDPPIFIDPIFPPPIIFAPQTFSLQFMRAGDADGTGWQAPIVLADNLTAPDISMQVVDGNPAVLCVGGDEVESDFDYFRALTPDGATWGLPLTVHSFPAGFNPEDTDLSLAVVNGVPAMAAATPAQQLFFSLATNNTGSSWSETVSLDTVGSVFKASLQEVNGAAAVSYFDISLPAVSYLRRDTPAGASGMRWPPELTLLRNNGILRSQIGVDFNNTPVGSVDTMAFTLRNAGRDSADLHISSVGLTGVNPLEFKILTSPQLLIPGGGDTHIVLAYTPLTTGRKSAEVLITSDTGPGVSPFVLKLNGTTQADISVERPGNRLVEPQSQIELPLTPVGSTADIAFIVRNTGAADLNLHPLLSVVMTGANVTEFTVPHPLPAMLPPGAAATLVLRHTPPVPGPRTIGVTITSNAIEPRDQLTFTLRFMPGSVDESFAPGGDEFFCVALEPGGRILAGANGTVAAFFADGSPDPSFFAPVMNGRVTCLAVQRNGGILAGGKFTQADGLARNSLVRLLPDGTVDASFDAHLELPVNALAILPDGKIFTGMDPSAALSPTLVRLLPDGTPDNTFQCSLTEGVLDIDVQPGGQVLVCGPTFNVNGAPARLFNENGSAAPLALQFTDSLNAVVRRHDGMLTGAKQSGGVVRKNTLDGSAPVPVPMLGAGHVASLVLQAEGACFVTGETIGGALVQPALGRVLRDGTIDNTFFVRADRGIWSAALQEDGKVVIAGSFRMVNEENVVRQGLVRLNNATSSSYIIRTGNTVRWIRGLTSPDVTDVSFEINTPGGNSGDDTWTHLGFGTRVAIGNDWELTGLTLPETCRIRARGRAGGSLTQTMESFPPPLEAWRLQHFGTTDNTGDAADSADPDKDGLTNFAEFAFGLNPVDGGSIATPPFILTRGAFTATFTAPEGRDARVLYRAAWSPSMQPGTWTPIFDTGLAPVHEFSAPATGSRVFVRWEVTPR